MHRESRLGFHLYNTNESSGPKLQTAQWYVSPTLYGRYLGALLKGWWYFSFKNSLTHHFEINFAIGGEDNMLQFSLVIPFAFCFAIGVRVPRALTRPWLYKKREWSVQIGYVGHWLDLLFASDEHMRSTGMDDYYRRKASRPPDCTCHHAKSWHDTEVVVWPHGVRPLSTPDPQRIPNPTGRCVTPAEVNFNSTPCSCRSYVPAPSMWNRVQIWPGIHWTFNPRLRDKIFGKKVMTSDRQPAVNTVVSMPEGNYPCTVTLSLDTWKRARWPFSRKVMKRCEVKMLTPIPIPGKGEDSWNCEDDALHSSYGPGSSVSEAISEVAKSVLRTRERYASLAWVPDAGWPVEVRAR